MNDDDLFFDRPYDAHFVDHYFASHLALVRALIASVWPTDRLKDPIPPYEEAP